MSHKAANLGEIFEAGLEDVVVYSQGSKLLGGLYRGAGIGPRPTAILLHGVPGVEKNLDIAYRLRDEGWNCLYFHPRGSWGSEGSYSFSGALDDVAAATDWLVAQPSVDPQRLAIVGNSFGGYLAFTATKGDPRFRETVSIAPLVDPTSVSLPDELFDEFALMLNGAGGEELKEQWDALPAIQTMSAALSSRSILLITAGKDELFPVSHYESLAGELERLTWVRIAEADHVFSTCRMRLVTTAVDWLQKSLGS